MNCSRLELLIDDYVDDTLAPDARAEVERHLAECADCHGAVEELRRLQRAVKALPRGIAPERDLLPGIRVGVGLETPLAGRLPVARWLAVAASLIVLTGAVWFGLRSIDSRPAPTVAGSGAGDVFLAGDLNLAEFEAAEIEYEEAAERLLEIVEARGDELSPETRAVIEENLRIIDGAIDQVREALNDEPDDTRNGYMLNALYRQKVEFLWRVSRLSS
jgi:hypothetical protein